MRTVDLAGPRVGELDVLDGQGLADLPEHGGAHARDSTAGRAVGSPGCGCRPPCCGSRVAPWRSSTSSWRRRRRGRCWSGSPPAASAHSDLHVVDGDLPEPLPLVLGHEAAGVVTEVGPGVERVQPGDHVVLALVPSCGDCEECRAGRPNFCEHGRPHGRDGDARRRHLAALARRRRSCATSTRSRRSPSTPSCPSRSPCPIRPDVPLDLAALIGCAVLTGWGGVTRTAGVESGARVAVFGCGGVGLSVIQAARIVGRGGDRRRRHALRQARARRTSRRHGDASRRSRRRDTARRVRHATGGGADYAFEAIGREETIREAWDSVRPGGTAVVARHPAEGHDGRRSTPGGSSTRRRSRARSSAPRASSRTSRGSSTSTRPATSCSRSWSATGSRSPTCPQAFDRLRAGEAVRQLVVFDSTR